MLAIYGLGTYPDEAIRVLTQIVAAQLAHRRDKSGVKAQVPMAKQSHSEVFTLFGARAFHSLSHC